MDELEKMKQELEALKESYKSSIAELKKDNEDLVKAHEDEVKSLKKAKFDYELSMGKNVKEGIDDEQYVDINKLLDEIKIDF